MQSRLREADLTCPRSHRKKEAGFIPRQQSDSGTPTLNFCCYQKQASFGSTHPKYPRFVNFNSWKMEKAVGGGAGDLYSSSEFQIKEL